MRASILVAASVSLLFGCGEPASERAEDASASSDASDAPDAASRARETTCVREDRLVVCERLLDPIPENVDDEQFQVLHLELVEWPSEPLSFDGSLDLIEREFPTYRYDPSDARLGGFVPAGVFVAAQIKRANPLLGGEERFARTEASGTLTPLPDGCVEVSLSPAPATGWITEPWVATACP